MYSEREGDCGVNPATRSLAGVKEKHFALGGWVWRSCCWNKHLGPSISRDRRVERHKVHPAPQARTRRGVGRGGAGGGADGGRKPGSRSD